MNKETEAIIAVAREVVAGGNTGSKLDKLAQALEDWDKAHQNIPDPLGPEWRHREPGEHIAVGDYFKAFDEYVRATDAVVGVMVGMYDVRTKQPKLQGILEPEMTCTGMQCAKCHELMRYNVPRLGSGGGYVHAATGKYECTPS